MTDPHPGQGPSVTHRTLRPLGSRLPLVDPAAPGPLWLHGASAGEVRAAIALAEHLGPAWITTRTQAGLRSGAAALMPWDLPGPLTRLFREVRPRALLLIEAELWPSLLRVAAAHAVPVLVAGAVVGPGTRRLLRWFRGARWVSAVHRWCAASAMDAEAYRELGIPEERIRTCGWIKWPSPVPLVGVAPTRKGLVLGSVYPTEVRALAERLRGTTLAPECCPWTLVPRHPRHHRALRDEATRWLPPGTWTLDSRFGHLRESYAHADAAYVGGGLAGRAVHNLLEPLAAGLRPLCWLRTGDLGCVAATLSAHGLAIDLDKLAPSADSQWRSDVPWSQILERFDGRPRICAVLDEIGVPR